MSLMGGVERATKQANPLAATGTIESWLIGQRDDPSEVGLWVGQCA